MGKKLQENSKYAMADADGDGIITDDEMDRHERWIRLENEDKLADTQRMMAWIAMVVTIVAVIVLLTPVVAIDRVATASGFLNTFIVAQLGVVVGFMGFIFCPVDGVVVCNFQQFSGFCYGKLDLEEKFTAVTNL